MLFQIVETSLNILRNILHNYGPKKLENLQIFEKNFKLLANNARPVARNPSVEFFKELYKWMGDNTFEMSIHPDVKSEVMKWLKTYEI